MMRSIHGLGLFILFVCAVALSACGDEAGSQVQTVACSSNTECASLGANFVCESGICTESGGTSGTDTSASGGDGVSSGGDGVSSGGDGSSSGTNDDTSGTSGGDTSGTSGGDTSGTSGGDTSGTSGGDTSGSDTTTGECAAPADCDAAYGAPPCGAWACNSGVCEVLCSNCADADHDGFGAGAGCAGPDCDDNDPQTADAFDRSCYSGLPATENVGTCRPGREVCVAGVRGPCVGEVLPSGEACNNQDDDCDTQIDEDLGDFTCNIGYCAGTVPACTAGVVGTCPAPAPLTTNDATCDQIDDDCDGPIDEDCTVCVKVAPSGDDTLAVSDNNQTPFLTIQSAITWAAADSTRPRNVCVAAGTNCGAGNVYNEDITMADGISVYANYESSNFTRCANSITGIRPNGGQGVLFPDTVQSPTALDGFDIQRATTTTTAAVTVDGARQVILSDLNIVEGFAVTNAYGVNIVNGGLATLTRSSVYAGLGTSESYGVRVVDSQVLVTNNCLSLDNFGRCDDFCGATNPSIRGRFAPGTGLTAAVYLESAPGSIIEQSALCGADADQGAGVKITGDATGTIVRSSLFNTWGGAQDAVSVWMEDCGGAAPWIVDNFAISAGGDTITSRVDAIRAVGDCHPVIDSNLRITSGSEGASAGGAGIYCTANSAGVASQCVVLGNLLIEGSANGYPPTALGVRCDADGCARIADNFITGRAGEESWGVWLGADTTTVVEDNEIHAGCATIDGIGLYAEDSAARIENNRIFGVDCPNTITATQRSIGLESQAQPGGNALDVHSNVIDARGATANCTGAALNLDATSTQPSGAFRNNILIPGACGTRAHVSEQSATSDPQYFENNLLDPRNTTAITYTDEGTTPISDPNTLTDIAASGNITGDPLFVSYPADLHLSAGSPCEDAGTPTGAPPLDMDDATRDATPDIGADEL